MLLILVIVREYSRKTAQIMNMVVGAVHVTEVSFLNMKIPIFLKRSLARVF